jgi:hypothetical protein
MSPPRSGVLARDRAKHRTFAPRSAPALRSPKGGVAHLGELDLKNRHFQIFLVLEPLILLGGTPENAL